MTTPAMLSHRWRLLDDGLLAYGLALLRTLWLWPVGEIAARSLIVEGGRGFPLWMIFALLAGGTLAAQLGGQRGKAIRAVLAVGGLAAVIGAVVVTLRADLMPLWLGGLAAFAAAQGGRVLLTLIGAGGLWWWGMRAGSAAPSYDVLARNFLWGLGGLVAVLGLNTAGVFLPRPLLLGLLLLYLALGLFLLALASIQATRRYERAAGDHEIPLPSHWWTTVLAVVGLLLLAALLLSLLFAPQTLDQLAAVITGSLALVGQVIAWVIAVITYPIFLLLAWLAARLPLRPFEGQLPELVQFAPPQSPLVMTANEGLAAPGDPTAWWIGGGLLILAVFAALFVLAMRRTATLTGDDVAETHEGILTLDLIKGQIADLLRRGRGAPPAPPYLALAGDDPTTRIRRTYQQMLLWAASHDHHRAPGATPDRFAKELAAALPAHAVPIRTITAAYTAARYGAAAAEAEAQRADAAWRQIQGA
jgi:hypothetical protein